MCRKVERRDTQTVTCGTFVQKGNEVFILQSMEITLYAHSQELSSQSCFFPLGVRYLDFFSLQQIPLCDLALECLSVP